MIGLYFSTVTHSEKHVAESLRTFRTMTGLDANPYFVASPASHRPTLPVTSGEEISCLTPIPHESLPGAMFVPPLRGFRDNYSAAMIALVYNAIREGGSLLIPYASEKTADTTGFWSVDWLRDLLGREQKISHKPAFMSFRRDDPVIPPESVFTAFTSDLEGLANAFIQERDLASDPGYLKECSDFITGASDHRSSGVSTAIAMMPDVRQGLEQFLKYATYSVSGAAYKTEALRRFIASYMPHGHDLSMVDIGGGMGFVDIELLLTCPAVQSLVNCEPVISTLPITKRLVERFDSVVKGRFSIAILPAQDYPFDEPIDVLSDFASLLYVPREDLDATLDRAWGALRPGGIFVIHENIRRPIFKDKSYYESVFTVKELDGCLERFGPIDRYRSTDMAPLTSGQAKDQTVFRIVQKPLEA